MMKVSKNGRRTIHLHNPSAVKYLEEYAEQNHVPMYKAMEMIIFELMTVNVVDSEEIKHDYVYIRYPLESLYLNETIDELLTTYNTVSIQKTSECYILRLEG